MFVLFCWWHSGVVSYNIILQNNSELVGVFMTDFHIKGTDSERLHNLAQVLPLVRPGIEPPSIRYQSYSYCYVAACSSIPTCGDEDFTISNLLWISLNCWKAISDIQPKSASFYFYIQLLCGSYTECPSFLFRDNHVQILYKEG